MNRLEQGSHVEPRQRRFWTRKRLVWAGAALSVGGVVVLPAVESAGERSYIKRCVAHRADTCGGDDRVRAEKFCAENPTAYVDNPAPAEVLSGRKSPYMTEAQTEADRCETAWLYHHRNDGLFGGLIRF